MAVSPWCICRGALGSALENNVSIQLWLFFLLLFMVFVLSECRGILEQTSLSLYLWLESSCVEVARLCGGGQPTAGLKGLCRTRYLASSQTVLLSRRCVGVFRASVCSQKGCNYFEKVVCCDLTLKSFFRYVSLSHSLPRCLPPPLSISLTLLATWPKWAGREGGGHGWDYIEATALFLRGCSLVPRLAFPSSCRRKRGM